MIPKKSICVFCSAQDVAEEYQSVAREIGSGIASNGYNLVWGGSDTGLMQIVSSSANDGGAATYGVSLELLREEAKKGATTMEYAQDLSDRKNRMVKKSDAFIVISGGIGTMDEFFYVLQLRKWNLMQHPIIIVNTNGFYDGLFQLLERMERERFTSSLLHYLKIVSSPEELFVYLKDVFS